MHIKNKNILKSKKGLSLLLVAALVISVGTAFGYAKLHDSNSATGQSDTSNTNKTGSNADSEHKVDYSPATKQDQQEADAKKDEIVKEQSSQSSNASTSATPVITYADQDQSTKTVEVDSYVSGIIEEGGTCRLTATKDGTTFTKESTGHKNAQNTICEPIRIARSEFNPAGDWSIKITYLSSNANGTSQTKTIKVQ